MEPASLHQSIVEFLNSASSAKSTVHRCDCGTVMTHRATTFFYEGQSWEVELPVCLKCNPAAGLVTHDA
jgi:hypothetical protein